MIYLRRLFQPRKPAFWLMLALNALSTALVWIVQNRALVPVAALLVAVFAIGNAALGLRFAWQLLQAPPDREDSS
ncbi:hypothetical protein [Rhodoferax sp. TH121]|uniref:hypothetical protein n=1 Tax=Rhodoferax sp. TH121 TaxID=2022803 RepID=UPI0020CFCA2C|nr:hypothetical protein [Rhodoferax sp. TH121]